MRSSVTSIIAKQTFDTIADAQRVRTVPELNQIFGKTLEMLGVTAFAGVNAVNARGEPDVEVLFIKQHHAWERHYAEEGHEAHDAIIREMLVSTEPLFWTDLPNRRVVTPEEARVIHEATDFGLSNGFMTPLHNIDGSISAVLLMGQDIEADDPNTRTACHLLSTYYGSIGRRLAAIEKGVKERKVKLSARERECLLWVRAGKSSQDIGDILNLSSYTVDEYIGSACGKLGVRTRIQAVAEAAIRRLITL